MLKNSATLIPSTPGLCLKSLRRLFHSYHAKKWPMLIHDDGNFRSTSSQHPRPETHHGVLLLLMLMLLLLLLLLLLPPPTCDEKNESLREVVEVFFLRG